MPDTDRARRTTLLTPESGTGTWTIDPDASSAEFRVRGMFGHQVRGAVPVTGGNVAVTGSPAVPTTIEARLDPASVRTGNDRRDEHLRSADLFDTAAHPEWSFVAESVQEA